jgi:eukaryotic-like serine/threonine-protein kinase
MKEVLIPFLDLGMLKIRDSSAAISNDQKLSIRSKRNMKNKHLTITITLLLAAFMLTGCGGEIYASTGWPGLTVDQGTAYLAYDNHVYAIDLNANGTEKWRFPEESDARITFFAPPTITPDGQLIVGGYNNMLYSLDPQSGQLNWEFSGARNRYIASALATREGIYAPDADKNMYALTLNGEHRWTFSSEKPTWAQPVTQEENGNIYLPSMDQRIYALRGDLNVLEPVILWQTEKLGGAIVGVPTLSEDGILYTGTFGRTMYAIRASDGMILWQTETEGWIWDGPALAGGRLYFGDLDGNFYALNAGNGNLFWKLTPDNLDGPIVGTPLVSNATIYVSTESGSLYALTTDGSIRWSQNVGGRLHAPPQVYNDILLVTPTRGDDHLVALNKNGAILWSFSP